MAATKKTTLTEPELDALMIAGNYSTLKIKIEFSPNNSQTYFSSKTLKCACDGVEQTKSVSLSQGGSVSKTFTFENINHDANGSKTVSWSWSIATGTTVLGTLKDSGSKQLQTIPRASELSVSSEDHYFGEDIQVTTTSKTYSKNTITYSIFGQQRGSYNTYYLIPNQTHTGTTNFPLSLINNIPNSTSATATFTCASTFAINGSSIPESDLGTSTLQVNLQVPDSVKPTATIGTLSEANSTMTSFSPRWNIYVQNHSQLSIPITANGTYSSKITSIKVTTNEETFNYNVPTPNTTISYTFTTGLLKTSGSNTINVEVTDTRGRKGTTSTTYNVVAYSSPTISSTSVERVSSGTAGQDNLKYSFVGSSNNIGNNASMTTFKVGYKLRDSSSYTYMASETLTGSSSINRSNVTVATPTLSSDNTYDIQFYVKDAFNEVSMAKELETEGDLLNFNDNGKAMAIGKVSEAGANEELLEVALPTTITNTLYTNNMIKSEVSTGEPIFRAKRTDTNVAVDMLVGSGGTNHGVFSRKLDKWMIYGDNNNINLSGGQITINSDGDLTKKLTLQQGSTVRYFNGGGGTTGYMKVATLTITQTYMNQPIIFEITQRSRCGVLYLQFAGGNTTDPSITDFSQTGKIQCYIKKTATSTWDLYIQKSEAYDNIEVCRLHRGYYSAGVTISWNSRGTTVSSLPSDYQTATGASILQTTTGNLSVTKTTGNSTISGTWARNGEIVCYDISISTTGTTNSGANLFEGSISNYTPKKATTLVGYLGSRAIIAELGTDKKIIIRNAGSSNISSGSTIGIRGTFIRG